MATDPNDLPFPALELSQYSSTAWPRKSDPELRRVLRLSHKEISAPPKVVLRPERRGIEIVFGLPRYRPGPALIRINRAIERDVVLLRLKRLRRLRRRPVTPKELLRDNIKCLMEVTKPRDAEKKLAWPMYSCELARLVALGLITQAQFEAGIEYIKLLGVYHAVIDAPATRRPSLVEREKLAWTRTDNPKRGSGRSPGKETYGAATGAPAALSGILTFPFRDQPHDEAGVVAPNEHRPELNRLVREYGLAGGVITKCPMGKRTLPIPRAWRPAFVPGKWRTGYVEFRWDGAQLLCRSPGVDPDTEDGQDAKPRQERRLGYMNGALAALQRAQVRADKKRHGARIAHAVRLVCEDDVPIAPDQLRDLKDGLTALSMFFTR
jgi:hypothetical protein